MKTLNCMRSQRSVACVPGGIVGARNNVFIGVIAEPLKASGKFRTPTIPPATHAKRSEAFHKRSRDTSREI